MVHAAYTPLTDAAVVRSGRSVGFTAAAHGPALAALKTTGRQVKMNSEFPVFSPVLEQSRNNMKKKKHSTDVCH